MDNNRKHRSFSSHLILIIKGLFLGFSTSVPFFHVSSLKECMKYRESQYQGDNFGKRLLYRLHENYTYFIGFVIGFLLFFFIPVKELVPFYPIAVYAGLGALILPFLTCEIFCFVRELKKEKFHIFLSAGIFALLLLLSFLFVFLLKEGTPDYSGFSIGVLLVFLLVTLSSFLSSFSGISVATLLLLLHLYVPYADGMRNFLYRDFSYLPLVALYLLGLLSGYVLHQLLLHFVRKDLTMEKRAAAIAIYIAGLVFALTQLHEPWYVEDKKVTEIAQMFVILSSAIACFFASFGLTIHRYPFFNRKDYEENNFIKEEEN